MNKKNYYPNVSSCTLQEKTLITPYYKAINWSDPEWQECPSEIFETLIQEDQDAIKKYSLLVRISNEEDGDIDIERTLTPKEFLKHSPETQKQYIKMKFTFCINGGLREGMKEYERVLNGLKEKENSAIHHNIM